MVGTKVKHISLGQGTIVYFDETHIVVAFSDGEHKFLYPSAFEKFITAEEIAQWAYFLTVINTFCTGQSIIVDGGESINYNFVWKE